MSLFGSSPPESTPEAHSKPSLFDDEAKAGAKSGSGLFDDDGAHEDSPWDMPTPKKGGRGELVKTLLPASGVPDSYIEAFDVLASSEHKAGGSQINLTGIKKLLEGLRCNTEKILGLVTGGKDVAALGRNEFNVLIALIGLAQEGEEATLDGVDERRKSKTFIPYRLAECSPLMSLILDLPEPTLPYLVQLKNTKVSENLEDSMSKSQKSSQTAPSDSPGKSRRLRKDSLENLDADPWAAPALHKGHTHVVQNEETPEDAVTAANPIVNGRSEPARTTSTFTTHADQEPTSAQSDNPIDPRTDSGTGGWGSYGASSGGGVAAAGLGGDGFGSTGDEGGRQPGGTSMPRSLGGGRATNRGVEETVTVTLLPEKEGMFMFQHHNYEVKSARRASVVIRRYSDFVWLLNCLHKRYPFRSLPLLPPKTLAGKLLPLASYSV